MTDNSNEAPERIWVYAKGYWCRDEMTDTPPEGDVARYTRADLARAQVAAAYEAAASKVAIHMLGRNKEFADRVVAHVRTLTPDDASAALAAMLKAERAKAYERAAVEISDYQAFTKYAQEPLTNEMCAAIRALAQEEE